MNDKDCQSLNSSLRTEVSQVGGLPDGYAVEKWLKLLSKQPTEDITTGTAQLVSCYIM